MEFFVHGQAFCNYASNPGCGGSAGNGVVTFRNIRHAWGALVIKLYQVLHGRNLGIASRTPLPQLPLTGCRVKPVLSIPRSYIRDLEPGQIIEIQHWKFCRFFVAFLRHFRCI